MQHKLENGELDLILVVNPKPNAQVVVEELKKDRFKFYITTKKDLNFDQSFPRPYIFMPEALAAQQTLQETLYTYQLDERPLHMTSSLESVKEFALHGLGIGLLPELVAKQAISAKKLKQWCPAGLPKKGIGEHSLGLAYHRSRQDSPLIKALIGELKKSQDL